MWEAIKSSFTDLTPLLWVSQISGLIGLLVIAIAYLFKKKKFLGISTISFVFFIGEQAFALLYSNLIVSSVCFIRNICMFVVLLKKDKELPLWSLFVFIGVMWGLELMYMGITNTFGAWDNYLPPAIVTMSTMTQNSKNEYVVKSGATLHETGFLIYYLIYHLPFSVLRQGILVAACIIGIVIYFVNTRLKKNKETEEFIE